MYERGHNVFNIGDVILYTTRGVCRIDDKIIKQLGGKDVDFFVLHLLDNQSSQTFYVNLSIEQNLNNLKPLLPKEEIINLINELPFLEPYWIENDNQRKASFAQILRAGDRKESIKMIRSIRHHELTMVNKSRKLHAVDAQAFDEAMNHIVDEFSYVLKEDKKGIYEKICYDIEQQIKSDNIV